MNNSDKRNLRNSIIVVIPFLSIFLSGCIVIGPAGGIFAHTVQKSNQDYDDIIVNMGYQYKIYYNETNIINQQRIAEGKPTEKIITFDEWIETQAKTKKERKAVDRYKRIHSNSP